MKTALVFGATSGIGKEIACNLSDYKVVGIGRNIEKCSIIPSNLELVSFDLEDESRYKDLYDLVNTKLGCNCPDLIVFSQGCAYYGLTENISDDGIIAMIKTNMLSTLTIASHYVSYMKQRRSGQIIFVSSVTASNSNPHGAIYGATKAGISSFARSLFDEVRKTNVKINIISPDLTDTDLYRDADFEPERDTCLSASDVAHAVNFCINQDERVNVLEITIKPQLNRIIRK